jgi:hypothetical protein
MPTRWSFTTFPTTFANFKNSPRLCSRTTKNSQLHVPPNPSFLPDSHRELFKFKRFAVRDIPLLLNSIKIRLLDASITQDNHPKRSRFTTHTLMQRRPLVLGPIKFLSIRVAGFGFERQFACKSSIHLPRVIVTTFRLILANCTRMGDTPSVHGPGPRLTVPELFINLSKPRPIGSAQRHVNRVFYLHNCVVNCLIIQ